MKKRPSSEKDSKSGGRLELIISSLSLLLSIAALFLAYFTSPLSSLLVPKVEYSINSEDLVSKEASALIAGFTTSLKITNASGVSAHEVCVEFMHDSDSTVTFSAQGSVAHESTSTTAGRQIIRIQNFPSRAEFRLLAEITFKEPARADAIEERRFFNGFGQVFHQHGPALPIKK
jgi:hypothetical protein